MIRKLTTWKLPALLAALSFFSGAATAEVIASVDRSSVELNESFTLKLTIDSQTDVEPDAAALEEDFYVGSRGQISNTTIMNGEVRKIRTWSFVLMAKREGELTIPPIIIGTEQSNAVRVVVSPQSIAVPGEADIFISAEIDSPVSYVQAQVLYIVKTYRAVATRQPSWSEPATSGVKTLVELAGQEKNYDALLNGKAYNVIERIYAFFPQESGELQIAPARFQARVLANGRITGRKVFQSEALSVVVKPIPPPPVDYPDAVWFPAKSVELRQEWSRDLDGLPAGEPITRHVTIIASGQLETQIPLLEPVSSPGVRVYPDKPELRTVAESTGVRAYRRDQYAMISARAGEIELPELTLPWWNVDTGEWQIASLPATRLTIVPPVHGSEPAPPAPVETSEGPAPAETVTVYSDLWLRVSGALLAVWILTLFFWWRSRRPVSPKRMEPQEPPIHKQQARHLKLARKAALSGDSADLKSALLAWGRLQWPDDPPRNIGDLCERVSMPLSLELNRLSSASYGPHSAQWGGEAMAKALRSFAVLSDDETQVAPDDLPPLYPESAV